MLMKEVRNIFCVSCLQYVLVYFLRIYLLREKYFFIFFLLKDSLKSSSLAKNKLIFLEQTASLYSILLNATHTDTEEYKQKKTQQILIVFG